MKNNIKNKINFKYFLMIFLIILIVSVLLLSIILLPILIDAKNSLPPLNIDKIKDKMSVNTMVYDCDEKPVTSLAEESFVSVKYDQLPQSFIDSLVAAEDSRFFLHKGVDGPRTLQSVIMNILKKDIVSGGSTITQQLIKLTSLQEKISDPETGYNYKHSNKRKIHEMILAYELESKMSKEEILASYANTISYGRFIGVGTAAKRYFNKSISQLTLPECILLAGIPQSSSKNNPYYYMENATQRYNTVCNLCERHNYLSSDEMKAVSYIPLSDILLNNQNDFINKNRAYFDSIENEINNIFKFNVDNEKDHSFPYYYKDLKIYTSMNQEQQAYADRIMNTEDIVPYSEMLDNIRNGWTQKDNLQASFVVVDNKNGEVPCIGAARNYNSYGYNMALHGYKSPGSVIKPIIDYAPGIEKYNWNINTTFKDEKIFYNGTNIQVNNFGESYSNANVALKDAISLSLNTTAVKAFQAVGPTYAGIFAGNLGINKIKTLLDKEELYESASLGGGIETTAFELAGAYSSFANGGIFNNPHLIRRIENSNGVVLYQYLPPNIRVMSPRTAKTITDALEHTRYTGTPATGARKQVSHAIKFAAKTGTSSYDTAERREYGISSDAEKDHWIAGYSPEYSIAVWTGFNVENKDFFLHTKGNVNANKKYGSYIMANWINNFSPKGTNFDFSNKPYNSIFVGDIPIKIDKDSKILSLKPPSVYYSTSIKNTNNVNAADILYNIYSINKNNEEKHLVNNEKKVNDFSYSGLNFDDCKQIKITATLNVPGTTDVSKSEKIINIV